jgi:predicted RNA-binding Zn-ribbon protein involved in translation (DUF1610 family)
MSISCDCYYDGDKYDGYYYVPDDFTTLETKRRKKCISCKRLMNDGDVCVKFHCARAARCEYEENRFGEEVQLAPVYMCEECGEIFLNLSAYGYCIELGDDMRECLQEHWEATGFTPVKAATEQDR